MEQKNNLSIVAIIIGLLISLGILGGGFYIGKGFYSARTNQPYISVKGLAERVVKSDLGVWSISYTVVGDDINTVNNELLRQQSLVMNFVKNQGFSDKEISFDQIKLVDRYANEFQSDSNKPTQRYLIKGAIRVRSNNVDRVQQSSQRTGDLVKDGIALGSNNSDDANPAFYFTQLNAIRPGMLSEATKSAFNVAAQFAKETQSKLGTIRRANQGIFEISNPDATSVGGSNNEWQIRRDEQTSVYKKIRLVSTIDYFLLNN